jgi:hypothetical protein
MSLPNSVKKIDLCRYWLIYRKQQDKVFGMGECADEEEK